ncbi:hypothetical protein [Methylibium petroleiphilum]|nr:hypothetical protein [Methylibium petroleiphilum]
MQTTTPSGAAPAATGADGYPVDLDGLIAQATALRAQHGNIPLALSTSGGWLSTLRLSVGRLGRGGARKLVSRGGDPVLVVSGR